jgi:hypothetical protein
VTDLTEAVAAAEVEYNEKRAEWGTGRLISAAVDSHAEAPAIDVQVREQDGTVSAPDSLHDFFEATHDTGHRVSNVKILEHSTRVGSFNGEYARLYLHEDERPTEGEVEEARAQGFNAGMGLALMALTFMTEEERPDPNEVVVVGVPYPPERPQERGIPVVDLRDGSVAVVAREGTEKGDWLMEEYGWHYASSDLYDRDEREAFIDALVDDGGTVEPVNQDEAIEYLDPQFDNSVIEAVIGHGDLFVAENADGDGIGSADHIDLPPGWTVTLHESGYGFYFGRDE